MPESSGAIISICLPPIFALVRRGVKHGPLSLLSSKGVSASTAYPRGQGRDEEGFTELHNSKMADTSAHPADEASEFQLGDFATKSQSSVH